MRIAILGATSHIAKNLIVRFLPNRENALWLFARDPVRAESFASAHGGSAVSAAVYNAFPFNDYDVVINCVGIADPLKQRGAGIELFRVTEHYDELALAFIEAHPGTRYVNFSSGAVYGTAFGNGVGEDSAATVPVNSIGPGDFYRIAKMNAEAKHRTFSGASIIDIRVFSFFSRFVDPDSGYLLSEILRSIRSGAAFVTTMDDIARDYVSPDDLFDLVLRCANSCGVNDVVDAYSAAPVGKLELVDTIRREFGLQVKYAESRADRSPTGQKNRYLSTNRRAERLFGFIPKSSSKDVVVQEFTALFSGR